MNPDPGPLWTLLQPFIMRELGFPLYAFDRPHCGSITALAEHAMSHLPAAGDHRGQALARVELA